jgi:hypothetical protein
LLFSASPTRNLLYCQAVWRETTNLLNQKHFHDITSSSAAAKRNNWDSAYLDQHQKCAGDRNCIGKVYKKCQIFAKKQRGLTYNGLRTCVFPIYTEKMVPEKHWKNCWKYRLSSSMKMCFNHRKKHCRNDLKVKKPDWGAKKVAKKCWKKHVMDKCMIFQRKKTIKSRGKIRWNVKRAKKQCRKQRRRKIMQMKKKS